MISIKYILSVLLYILLLPISTPAAFIGARPCAHDDLDWGGGGGNGGRGSGIGGGRSGSSGAGASIFTNGNLLERIGEQSTLVYMGGIV